MCGVHLRRFLPDGIPIRTEALCPICQSKEVHRISWLLLKRKIGVTERKLRFLHVAPEPVLRRRLGGLKNLTYISGDLQPGVGDLAFNIYQLPFADKSFDVVFLSHVLNALPDDMPALREILRVLTPGGVVIPPVPLQPGEVTREAFTREERIALCSDPDIFRIYGEDLRDRMQSVGFDACRIAFYEECSHREHVRFGLQPTPLVIGTRPAETRGSQP